MASTSMRLALWKARDGASAAGEMVADEAMRLPAFTAASQNIRESIGSSDNVIDLRRMDSARKRSGKEAAAQGTGEIIGVDDLVLVMGSTGFVGARVVTNLLSRGLRNFRDFVLARSIFGRFLTNNHYRHQIRKNLLIPHGFEPNYLIGFPPGLAANGIDITVASSDEIGGRLRAAGISERNLRGSQETNRSAGKKAANLVRYYLLLLWTVVRHRGGAIHFNGLLSSRIIFIDGV